MVEFKPHYTNPIILFIIYIYLDKYIYIIRNCMSIYSDHKKDIWMLVSGVNTWFCSVCVQRMASVSYVYEEGEKERMERMERAEEKVINSQEIWRDSFYQDQRHYGDPSSNSTRTPDASPKQVIDHLSALFVYFGTKANNRDGHHAGRLISRAERWQRIRCFLLRSLGTVCQSIRSVPLHLRLQQQLN